MRQFILLCALVALAAFGWAAWRNLASQRHPAVASAPSIDKQPAVITSRSFDPSAPPSDMPPMSIGEEAVCDSRFLSNARVAAQSRRLDATHAIVTITGINVTLQLNVTIWTPSDAPQHVIEHEDGHRQISEYYYRTADRIAARIAAPYIGKQMDIAGADLNAESSKVLAQAATEITDEYNKALNPEPTQQLYDSITDHSRNDVNAHDAAAAAIKNAAPAAANQGN